MEKLQVLEENIDLLMVRLLTYVGEMETYFGGQGGGLYIDDQVLLGKL